MNRARHEGPGARRRAGIALLAGLVLLSALSLLAVVAATSMSSQQRMAGNYHDTEFARANAGRAQAGGHALLLATPDERRMTGCQSTCFRPPTDTLIQPAGGLPALPEFESGEWWRGNGLLPGTDPLTAAPPEAGSLPWAEASRFVVEEVAFRTSADIAASPEAPAIDGIGYYRILGRGTGRQVSAVAVDEAIVARPWPGHVEGESPPADWNELCAPFRPWYHCGPMTWRARR